MLTVFFPRSSHPITLLLLYVVPILHVHPTYTAEMSATAHLSYGDDLEIAGVLNAVNPHPRFDYFHGPIPNNNSRWQPHSTRALRVSAENNSGAM
ncbi:hypothetical protein BO99DRAFT_443889 [Aspergillus violaceofuscus CBS 115571]|uniref:Secreted protein n=1 Tax=Aspergillus violaceofuscus (strain CBS 115571) TaxID=1450538 RepID=A0A2V5H4R2_ASPV1|nr:hypothetical protein BO99DRAFT_443889 [Aspergillus violaceofuscus CBS 115571]